MLLSESDLPLYDPLTFYQQLMSETKSRLNACGYPKEQAYVKSSMWRWTPPMQARACCHSYLHCLLWWVVGESGDVVVLCVLVL